MARATKVPGEQTPPETETTEQNTNTDKGAGQTVQAQQDQPSDTTTANPEQPPSELDAGQLGETGEQTPPDWAIKLLAGQARIEAKLRSMSLPQAQATQHGTPPIQQPKQSAQVLTAQGWGSKES
ncbi:hypothetical protein QLH32_05595 [Acinetobacter corruptisaponis]|uniref:Uncharacterized protein n=1 Tax=Acinetobacter corruptisaponis TaxID=3045147 RepID=A0ABY8S5W2_9GAMM|nr:hypothetical protein [Acinetobacter sp. KCTC 92772]WHP06940.1 hypothetical protein QLH32_05595 [Acinetobacter sp. KCTC 92772]